MSRSTRKGDDDSTTLSGPASPRDRKTPQRMEGYTTPAHIPCSARTAVSRGSLPLPEILRNANRQRKSFADRKRSIAVSWKTSADGYNEVDLKGNLMLVNDSLCEITGYSREKLIGLNYREFVDETNAKKVFEAYNQVYKTGKANRGFYFEITRRDGSKRNCMVSISL